MEENQLNTVENSNLLLTQNALEFIKVTAKWAHFLGILGYIGVAMLLIGAFSISSMPSQFNQQFSQFNFPMGILTVVYVALALFYFFPVYYLHQFGKKTKQAILKNDDFLLENGFKNLKSHYKFIGVFSLVIISLYVLMFIGLLVGVGIGASL